MRIAQNYCALCLGASCRAGASGHNSREESARYGEQIMRAFLMACFAIIVIGTGGYFFLDSMQKPSGVAFSTEGARIIPQWSWRSVFRRGGTGDSAAQTAKNALEARGAWAEECEPRSTWQWIFVDLGTPQGEPAVCSDSQ
jgi:hypothetical protein